MTQLRLYGTSGCHLCEVAEQLLAHCIDFERVQVELIDIADDDRMVERLGVRIPVLEDSVSGETLDWPFDAEQVARFLTAVSARG
ncbi:glutaredoxin family protein [Motiliproteus sediminis]|uniref:glutaredoxin family protein n=1 Tax=Motiliproteus sediminis TaxID=1468178 RepID=UPI001AEFFD7D|nr:glutaredoxin family protein [Motiliproteus sediminis]